MTTTTIPPKTIRTCDCCGKTDETIDIFYNGCKLSIFRSARDFQGAACADASIHRDLCSSCTETVISAINEIAERTREPHPDRGIP